LYHAVRRTFLDYGPRKLKAPTLNDGALIGTVCIIEQNDAAWRHVSPENRSKAVAAAGR
jgi:hypothetical protein